MTSFALDPEANDADKDVAYRYCVGDKLNLVNERSFKKELNDVDRNIIYQNYTANSKL